MSKLSKIYIHDINNAKDGADKLTAAATELESVKVSIDYILKELGQFWAQTQEDAQDFAASLTQHVQFLDKYVENSKKLSYIISNYVEQEEKISSKSV